MYCITKWTRHVTDSEKDEYTKRLARMKAVLMDRDGAVPPLYRFRLLDDDGIVYAYGVTTVPDSFDPLDKYMYAYGVTEIQYMDPATKKYETL